MVKCTNCGETSRIRQKDNFCHHCGHRLKMAVADTTEQNQDSSNSAKDKFEKMYFLYADIAINMLERARKEGRLISDVEQEQIAAVAQLYTFVHNEVSPNIFE